jgi:hypothetical protein
MTRFNATVWYLDRSYSAVGDYTVTIWAQDQAGNVGTASGSFSVVAAAGPPGGLDVLVVGAILLVVIIGVAIAFLASRRKRGPQRPPPSG